jgi:arsenical pump membrane protein
VLAISGALLILVLAFAVIGPRGLPEAVGGVPAAIAVVAVGALSGHEALSEIRQLLPVVLFLAAILVVGDMCEAAGVFRWAGEQMGRGSGGSSEKPHAQCRVLLVWPDAAPSATTIPPLPSDDPRR